MPDAPEPDELAPDLVELALDAIYAALDVPAVTSLAPVHITVPEGEKPPFIEIGAIDSNEAGEKDGGLELLAFEIEFQHRGPSRRPLLAMMNATRRALRGADLIADGASFESPRWRASATDRDEETKTYHGIQRFELLAQSSD